MSNNFLKDNNGKSIYKEEIQMVCDEHYLGKLTQILNVTGKMHLVIIIETSTGKYVLRYLSYPISKDRINYIEETILTLKEALVPVVNAIKNKNGDYYSIVNNKTIQVYPFIKGYEFSFKPVQIKSSGNMLKKFHLALCQQIQGPFPNISNHPSEENLKEKYLSLYKKRNILSISSFSRIESLYTSVLKQWKSKSYLNLPQTIIHNDWHPWNQIYNNKDQVECIIDLDGVQHGLRIYDVAYGLYMIFIRSSKDVNKKNSKLFLDGYGELTEEEKSILSLVVAKILLFFMLAKVENAEGHLNAYESLIRFLLSNKGKSFFL